MKILLLTQVLPYPPDSGPKIKTWNVIKYLARQHEITLVSFVRGDQSAEVEHLQRYCRTVHTVEMKRGPLPDGLALLRSLAGGQPWMMVRDERPAMQQLVDTLASQNHFDIAHADQLNMAQYARRVSDARKIMDAHNALWLLYRRLANTMRPGPKKWLLERDWRLLKRYEGQVCREFDAVLTVSTEDKHALEEAIGHPHEMAIIPIAIDVDEFPIVVRKPDADHILHFGTMYWPPNIDGIHWFLDEILPWIRQKRPESVVDLVGARPPQSLVERNQKDSRINVTGYVPDLLPYMEQAGVFVVPLRAGGGMRVKILEALARGLPLVTTTLGCEGIAVEDGRHVLIADTPEGFANAVLRLLADRSLADQLGKNGRQLIENTYDYRAACQPLDRVYHPSNSEIIQKTLLQKAF